MMALEIEFKYSADQIPMAQFTEFCLDKLPNEFINASGYDHFYSLESDPSAFCRHRQGPDMNQLTFKRKKSPTDNYIRTEHNIDLKDNVHKDQIEALCKEFGYDPSFSLFKNCFIYKYDTYILVYYICYDISMKELGRFIEIEMSETYPWRSVDDAWKQLIVFEKLCKPLGLNSKLRVKDSLFEMFKPK